MSLLDKIKCIDLDAAKTLEENNFVSDREIKSLRPEDLHKLFHGSEHEKLRLAIMDLIGPKDDTCLKKLKDSVQPDSLRAALANDGFLADYLNILREMKNQMDHVQSSLDAHINFVEEIHKEKSGESSYGEAADSDMQTASLPSQSQILESESWEVLQAPLGNGEAGTTSETSYPNQPGQQPLTETQPARGFLSAPEPKQAKGHQKKHVTYQIVVSGKTFNAHQQLMDKLKKKVPLVEFDKSKQDHEITILFCPISTRIAIDVNAAMREVKDKKPVILVLMHHCPEPRCVANQKTWDDYPNIELFVNVFYHDSAHGLIKCEQNGEAIHHIKERLREIYTKNNPETSKTPRLQKWW